MSNPSLKLCWAAVLLAVVPATGLLVLACLWAATLGVSAVVLMAVSLIAAVLVWDRQIHWPNRWASYTLGGLAIALGAAALVVRLIALQPESTPERIFLAAQTAQNSTALAIASGCVALIWLLWCHRRRASGIRLTAFALPWIPLALAAYPPIHDAIATACLDWIISTSSDLLNLANVPHLLHDSVLSIREQRFLIDHQLQGIVSWPAFVGWALLFSAFRNRNWTHLILNAGFAFLLCIAFHSGWLALVASDSALDWSGIATNLWPWICGLAVIVAFLSGDQFFAGLLHKIGADNNAATANPIVHLWNAAMLPAKQPNRSVDPPKQDRLGLAAVAGVLLLSSAAAWFNGVQTAGRQLSTSRIWTPSSGAFENLLGKYCSVDYVQSNQRLNAMTEGVSDTWVFSAPTHTSRLVISQTALPRQAFRFGANWQETQPVETDPPEPDANATETAQPDETAGGSNSHNAQKADNHPEATETAIQPPDKIEPMSQPNLREEIRLTRFDAVLGKRRALAMACFLNSAGQLINHTGPQTDTADQRLLRVVWFADLGTNNNTRAESELATAFEQVLQQVGSQMTSKPPGVASGSETKLITPDNGSPKGVQQSDE